MAKLCMTQRETKRLKMVEKFKVKRLALNEVINDSSASREQKIENVSLVKEPTKPLTEKKEVI
jgi:hypothetical protein